MTLNVQMTTCLLVLCFLVIILIYNQQDTCLYREPVYLHSNDSTNFTNRSLIVILTYMRSGSSFVGDILQQNRDVFYLFEPLRYAQFEIQKNKSFHNLKGKTRFYSSFLNAGEDIIRNWTLCKLFDLPDVIWTEPFLLSGLKTKLFSVCKLKQSHSRSVNQTLYNCVKFLKKFCRSAKYIVIKTIRLPLDRLEPLMEEYSTMKIIHLVRDPRASVMSQMKLKQFVFKETFNSDVLKFCYRIYRDLITADIFKKKFQERIFTLFYEDLAKDPISVSRSLFKFANIEYSFSVQKYVRSITDSGTHSNCGPYCTRRQNSTAASHAWRSTININYAQVIDQMCGPVYEKLGIRSVKNEQMLRDISIPLYDKNIKENDFRYW